MLAEDKATELGEELSSNDGQRASSAKGCLTAFSPGAALLSQGCYSEGPCNSEAVPSSPRPRNLQETQNRAWMNS